MKTPASIRTFAPALLPLFLLCGIAIVSPFALANVETSSKSSNGSDGLSGANSANVSPRTYIVVSCNDGDTCRLKSPDNVTLKVRLVGIDAPEFGGKKKKGQPLSSESKAFINELVQGKSVTLNALGSDAYNRSLAEIYIGETNVNLEIVRAGLAEVYQGKPPKGLDAGAYARAEAEAKAARKGVWALTNYQSPKDFRKRNK
jgi:endonuclease YncB( thermonuclease family)